MVVSGFYLIAKIGDREKKTTQIVVSEKVSNTLTKYLKSKWKEELEMKIYGTRNS